jgi:hypothetical protein
MTWAVRPGIIVSGASIPFSRPTVPIGPEMPVSVPGSISLVTSVIIVPVVAYSFKWVSVQSIGYIIIVNTRPWTIVIGGRIPGIPGKQIEEIVQKEKVVGHADRGIKPQLGRLNKYRRLFNLHRLVWICGCRLIWVCRYSLVWVCRRSHAETDSRARQTDGNPCAEADIGSVHCRRRNQKNKEQT